MVPSSGRVGRLEKYLGKLLDNYLVNKEKPAQVVRRLRDEGRVSQRLPCGPRTLILDRGRRDVGSWAPSSASAK